MALTTGFMSGSFAGTYDSNTLGLIADAFRIQQTFEAQGVRADYYGDSVIDLIPRGGNAFCIFEGLNWGAVTAIVGGATSIGNMGIANMGSLVGSCGLAKALVLTARNQTCGAAANSPVTITSASTFLAEGFNIEYSLGNSLRTLPIMLRMLPTLISSEVKWYVMA
jgi:hypothetical protein